MNELIKDFNSKEKEKIARVSRRLLNETFIYKNKDSVSKEDYSFIRNNEILINDILEPLGYKVVLNRRMELAALSIKEDITDKSYIRRLQFSAKQSIFVLILYQYYLKKKQDFNALVLMNNEDLDNELKIFNIDITKKEITEIITKLKRHNIVDKKTKEEVVETDGEIIIFPSILLTIDIHAAESKYELIKQSMTNDMDDEIEEEYYEENNVDED